MHPTQSFETGSHDPVVPLHADAFVDEHWKHAPFTHAGYALDGHGCAFPVPKSPVHDTHPPARHTGSPFGQSVDDAHV